MLNSPTKTTLQLLTLAKEKQIHAHAPYSNFHVGAAILDEHGQQHASCNVENAAYPLGQCAEAGAISAMVAAGNKHIKQILIVSPNDEFCPPCGGCRQKIAEFANQQTQVHMAKSNGEIQTLFIGELLPLAFNLDNT
jgi:cytidine deaminase